MGTSTALAYQMMIEEKLLFSMINAEQRMNYYIASRYAYIHCLFLKCKDIPAKPIPIKGTFEESGTQWQAYYFTLLEKIAQTASDTIAEVRVKYGKQKGDMPT